MSLWQIEVEKSKVNPAIQQRKRKFGTLNRLFLAPRSPITREARAASRYLATDRKPAPYDRVGVNLYADTPKPQYREPERREANQSPERRQQYQEPQRRQAKQELSEELLLTQNLNRLNQELSDDNARLRRQVKKSSEMAATQQNIDQIAQLIIQKSQLEHDMKMREEKYRELLNESQDLTKMMRLERDAALSDLKSSQGSQGRSQGRSRSNSGITAHGRSRSGSGTTNGTGSHRSRAPPPPLPPLIIPMPSSPPPPQLFERPRFTDDELQGIFQQHDDLFFKDQFQRLEASIKQFVLTAMKSQPDTIMIRDLTNPMDYYIATHNLNVATIFGIRDVRCIVCRGFLMEFLLDRVFRVFLFGITNDHTWKEAFQAMSASDLGRGSKWAATVAKQMIRFSTDYRPEKAAQRLITEIKTHLAPFIDFTEAPNMLKVIMKAAEVARDCRLSYSSFSLEMPVYLAPFDPMAMESSAQEQGNVMVTYSPVVTQRGNKYGEEYQFSQVLVKAKVWRESIFSELHNLMEGPIDTRERYE